MRRSLLRFLILLVFAGSPPSNGQELSPAPRTTGSATATYDGGSFAAELHRISDILKKNPSKRELLALRSALPRRWTVTSREGSFSVSSEPLRDQLTNPSRENAEAWVNHLAEEVEYSAKPATSSPQARGELERILKRPEFEPGKSGFAPHAKPRKEATFAKQCIPRIGRESPDLRTWGLSPWIVRRLRENI